MKNLGMIVLMIIIGCIPIIAQKENKDSYLVNAKSCFDKGEYQKARSYIIKYAANDGDRKIAKELSTKCQSCEDYLSKANAAYVNGEILTAEQYYIKLKELNPKHPGIREAIDKCKKRISGAEEAAGAVESSLKKTDKPKSSIKEYWNSLSKIFKDDSYIESGKNEFTACGFGGGYPGNVAINFEYRGGGVIGYGLYGEIGLDLTRIDYEPNGEYKDDFIHKTFRYAGGIKFYPYKGFFIDAGYGTIAKTSAKVTKDLQIYRNLGDEEKKKISDQISIGYGWLFHVGCISVSKKSGSFFSVSGGIAYDVVNKETVPSINIKVGPAW